MTPMYWAVASRLGTLPQTPLSAIASYTTVMSLQDAVLLGISSELHGQRSASISVIVPALNKEPDPG